jgi:UDP-glucose 4-epimerase
MTLSPLTWVIGGGGLLGTNVERAIALRGEVWRPARSIAWGTPDARSQLATAVAQFASRVGDHPWQVAWCAGAGVTTTTADLLAEEARLFDAVLEALSERMRPGSDGAAFLASSAGGLYAGSSSPPFTEESPVSPVSPYGKTKLHLERTLSEWAAAYGWPVVVGRIANLYGAGQNLWKTQGLISQICRAHLLRRPVSIYVPLDTIRDYLYARDCGELVAEMLTRARQDPPALCSTAQIKILASQQGVTIGALLAEARRVLKQRIKVAHAPSTTAGRYQARDLRLRSVVWPELDRRALTPLPVGIRATTNHLMRQIQLGSVRA